MQRFHIYISPAISLYTEISDIIDKDDLVKPVAPWLPVALLVMLVILARPVMPPWVCMVLMTFALLGGFKLSYHGLTVNFITVAGLFGPLTFIR